MIAPRDNHPPATGNPGTPARGQTTPTPPAPTAFTCLLCETPMYGAHCKLHCPNCGYREDCSDLFRE